MKLVPRTIKIRTMNGHEEVEALVAEGTGLALRKTSLAGWSVTHVALGMVVGNWLHCSKSTAIALLQAYVDTGTDFTRDVMQHDDLDKITVVWQRFFKASEEIAARKKAKRAK